MSTQYKVFVVDDDEAVRSALAMLLTSAGYQVEIFSGSEDFLELCTPDCEGCLILDVSMPGMDGPALQQELLKRSIRLPIIFLTGHGTIQTSVRTIKAGAMDFLTKPVDGAKLLACVQEALQKGEESRKQAGEVADARQRLAMLTEREREVMKQVIAGHTCKEIAQQLDISHRTVEIHRAHVMEKAGVSNLAELARIYWIVNQ
jgi:FixJ family two-component response regulator